MALVHPGWIIAALLSLIIFIAVNNPTLIIRGLHLHSNDFLYLVYRQVYIYKSLAIGLPAGFAVLLFVGTWSWWQCTYLELNRSALTYRLGPFSSNSIPRRAVQDVSVNRGIGGMIFGYGTLRIYAGREIETIPFVPNVEQLATVLQGPPDR